MIDDEHPLLDDFAHLLSPTLKENESLVTAMKPVPSCAVCPMGQWYKLQGKDRAETVECFCTAFRDVMYRGGTRVVTACDARLDAIDAQSRTAAA